MSHRWIKPVGRWIAAPGISFLLHAIVLVLLIRYAVGKITEQHSEIEVSISDVEIKEVVEQTPTEISAVATAIFAANDIPLAQTEPRMTAMPMEADLGEIVEPTAIPEDRAPEEMTPEQPVEALSAVPETYATRKKERRQELVAKHGGGREGQESVLRALRWLQSVQSPNGSWDDKPAHSALALLCFLAHGETPESAEFGVTIQRALAYLTPTMPSNGAAIGNSPYIHGIVTYALAEAYGMTKLPMLRKPMEDGLRVIVAGQQAGGGFDYKYEKGDRWDLSITGWQVQAMKAGLMAGAAIPELSASMERATQFVKTTFKNGKFGYSSPGSGGNMTGVGALCLQLLGEGEATETKDACDTIANVRLEELTKTLNDKSWSTEAGKDLYGWYYETQAMFHRGGADWKKWNATFQELLTRHQSADGHWEVAKAAYGLTEDLAGRVYCTTLCCLQLEVYYRYLPTYQTAAGLPGRKTARRNILDEFDSGLKVK